MYLDFDLDRPMFMLDELQFVGRTGRFVPVMAWTPGAGILYRVKDGKHYAVTGTKNFAWMEAEVARSLGNAVEIDMSYFEKLIDAAKKTIGKFGDFDNFVS